jgi:hypothetical protein
MSRRDFTVGLAAAAWPLAAWAQQGERVGRIADKCKSLVLSEVLPAEP